MRFKDFTFFQPGMVRFGAGSSAGAGARLKELGLNRALLLSDRGLEKAGMVKKMEEILAAAGIAFSTYLDVEANPSIETVEKGIELFKEKDLQGILCLGEAAPWIQPRPYPL